MHIAIYKTIPNRYITGGTMIVTHTTNEATLSNVATAGEFKIRNSAKAFSILSAGLYSNKIRAIIRELSTNAIDSHIAAGKKDLPIQIHLPSVLEPWFSVRDFGLGLDHEQVTNIYTTYFESTKTESNDFIGALGLGSKSPFSYTENFTVTAIKDGVKRIYSAYINEMGIPCIAKMNEESVDDSNGVEIQFSVSDKYDYSSFRSEANNVYRWFPLLPEFVGEEFTVDPVEYLETNIIPGVHRTSRNQGSVAVMGNIAYPLGNIPEAKKHLGELSDMLNAGLVIEFSIGELDFAASREELSFIPSTIDNIRKKLEALSANLQVYIASHADKIKCKWSRATYLYEQAAVSLYSAAVKKYVTDTNFELFDLSVYKGTYTFAFNDADLAAKGLKINSIMMNYHGKFSTINRDRHYSNMTYTWISQIPVRNDAIFVLNDLTTGCVARVRYHFKDRPRVPIHCISFDEKDLVKRKAKYKEFLKSLHNPPNVVMASTLDKAPSKKSVSATGILVSTPYNYINGGSWNTCTDELDSNQTYYYVALANFSTITLNSALIDFDSIMGSVSDAGLGEMKHERIYGVRKSRINEIKKMSNWVWFEDKIKEELGNITDADLCATIMATRLDSLSCNSYNKKILQHIPADSDYRIYMDKYFKKIDSTYMSHNRAKNRGLEALFKRYNNPAYARIAKEISLDSQRIEKKYKLLNFLRDAPVADIAEYINMVDTTHKEKS